MTFIVDTAGQRAALAAAATLTATVDGSQVQTTGHLSRPDVVNAYDAWPQTRQGRVLTKCLGEVDWWLLLALPGGDAETTVFAHDDLVAALVDAMLTVGQVTLWEPVIIPVTDQPNAGLPGLRLQVTI